MVILVLTTSLAAGCRNCAIPQPPTRTVTASQAAAEAFAARLAALASAQGAFTLAATEQELTSYALANLAGTPVQDISIWLEPDGIHAQATVGNASDHKVYAFMTVTCHEGVVQVELSYVALDGHSVPRWILASAEKALNDALADMQTSFQIERIELSAGSVLVYGSIA